MEVDVRILLLFFTIFAGSVSAQERCAYMIAIPRDPKPDDLPELDFEGVPWSERPLIPAPERDDDVLCMDGYHPINANMGTQVIYMEEEIEGNVVIAKLNYYGSSEPYIEPQFAAGTFSMLGPAIQKFDDGFWYIVITQRQDYETPGMQRYYFNVRVPSETLLVGVSLLIVNIDDNPPIIQAFDACHVPELGEPRLTDCVYTLTDADGEISTRFMTFRIDSDRGDENVFYIEGTNVPGDWYTMHMTVGISQTLDFEENPLHIFTVTALDSLPNTQTVTLMVRVENVEHRPPRWVEIFAVQQFDEKTYQSFTVRAIDGDTGINKPIYYTLDKDEEDTFFRIETIPGGRDGAIFYVDSIDRDTLEREVFQLSIIAYKYDNESFATSAPVVIIVNDINDNAPLPIHEEYSIDIEEETAMTLELEEFGFHDRDLGQNAQYTVKIESVSPEGAHNAFYISPTVGYQRQTFIVGTSNLYSMLDYEVPEFQNIVLRVVATDMNNTDFSGVAMLHINLINWNDELPIFEQQSLTVSFDETEGEGFHVGRVRAHDRDIGDRVVHSLMGNAGDFLSIDENTGDIYVTANDSFDYHRQNVIFVQVRADDTLQEPYHTETAQLVIELQDINNTPPTLRLPRGSPHVEENRPVDDVITEEIVATDPDTTAYLVFEIDWDTSYATKQGRETNPAEYHGCVEIETEYPDPLNFGSAIGRIVVQEVRPGVTIDFEEFEVLYLTIRVKDINTVEGIDYDESTFTITIVDLNDNPPVWAEGTLEQEFRVREMSASGVVIGSVLATDIDGPLYNQVRYTIFSRNNTPDDLVSIDFYTGQITVKTSDAIDADIPKRWYLYYLVIASDKCYAENPEDCPPDPNYFDTEGELEIFITDTNNRQPEVDFDHIDEYDDVEFEADRTIVYIYENATTGDEVILISAIDLDRDEIYNTVRYQINYMVNPRLLSFFSVDLNSGQLLVNYTTNEVLDRDRNEAQHIIFVNLIDNFYGDGDGNRNTNSTEILVVLRDVNDNAPELPHPSTLTWSLSENLLADMSVQPIIHAPDIDEPGTDNSLVGFRVLDLTVQNRDIEVPTMFDIRSIDTDKGELFTTSDLRGYWGTYTIHIHAFDHGYPQQHSYEDYELTIRPYNYHAPVFVFPVNNAVIRLAREQAMMNVLVTVDGNLVERITATDEDGLEAGIVTFTVTGNDEAMQYFSVTNDGLNLGSLTLVRQISESLQDLEVTIRATDGGTEPDSKYSEVSFRIVFVPITGNPIFQNPTATVAFIEFDAGMLESHELPKAEDPKNYMCERDCHDIFYTIVDGNIEGYFQLNAVDNVISLQKPLDRNIAVVHTLTIAASNSLDAVSTLPGSTLVVTVNVREADPRPIFERDLYTAGISVTDTINRVLLTVRATHTEGSPITYTIDRTSMVVDQSLEAVRDSAFDLNPDTGVLRLQIQPTASMHGMFEFNVVASDPADGTDVTVVRVYLISSQNRVTFIFINSLQVIEDHADFIAQTFSQSFGMVCNIDQVIPSTDELGLPRENSTEVRSHFIRDDEPVLADEIELLRRDTILLREIQSTLDRELLVLEDFYTELSPEVGTDASLVTIYVLGALSALLAFMCLLLLLTYIIRTRTLNRRLEALSMTKYGSVDSGLNRLGAAPGTNKHAVEGSNPIWNETIRAPDFDAISDTSDDSDLIGIEDLPQFRNDYFPSASNGGVRGASPVATHDNNFGFNASPFSTDFANRFEKKN